MNEKELEFILQEGEGYKIEFKEGINNIDKEMVAFANAEGGRIFIGVSDDNKLKGIEITNKLKSDLQHTANNCDPSIEIKLEKFKNILIIEVKEGKDKPYKCKEGFYLRQGANSQKLKRDEIINLVIDEGKIKFDEQINKEFDFKKDFDKEKLASYLKKTGIDIKIPLENILINLSVAKKQNNKLVFNNAGVLFFAKEPKRFISSSGIICVRYHGNIKGNIIDRQDFYSDTLTNIENSIMFIKKNTRVASKVIDFYRVEKEEYPYEAVREALLNAVMHKDYFITNARIFVNIYDDRIEVISPGSLPKGVTLKNLGEISVPRNDIITDLMLRTDLIEKLGTGVIKMNKLMKEHGLKKPEYKEIDDVFEVIFFGPGEKITELIPEKKGLNLKELGLNERQIEALRLIVNKHFIFTNRRYREYFKIGNATAKRDLMELVKVGLIEKIGAGKAIKYKEKK